MSITYSFLIVSMKKKFQIGEFKDVVYEINYRGYAVSQEHQEIVYNFDNTITFDTLNLNQQSFTSFDQINKDTIISWILQKEGVSSLEEVSFVKYAIQYVQEKLNILEMDKEIFLKDWHISNTLN